MLFWTAQLLVTLEADLIDRPAALASAATRSCKLTGNDDDLAARRTTTSTLFNKFKPSRPLRPAQKLDMCLVDARSEEKGRIGEGGQVRWRSPQKVRG